MPSQNGDILLRKLHSMRETPQQKQKITCMKKTTRHIPLTFQNLQFLSRPHMCHVKMSLTRGQYAWFSTFEGHDHHDHEHTDIFFFETRSGKERERVTSVDLAPFRFFENPLSMENHQRLNVEKHSQDWLEQWLVGLVDGDGCFSVDCHRKSTKPVWNLVFKLSLKKSNMRALTKAKTILGAGEIKCTDKNSDMMTLRIRNRDILEKRVFPIFTRYPLLSDKYYQFVRVREISRLLNDTSLSEHQRGERIQTLWDLKISRDSISPFLAVMVSPQSLHTFLQTGESDLEKSQVTRVITLPWLSGFLEAEGSFYIVKKDPQTGRFCHAFGLSQGGNKLLMEAIRCCLRIGAQVKKRTPKSFSKFKKESQSFYSLETTNWRTLHYIRDLLFGHLLGIKSQEFRIWERSMKFRENWEKLEKIQHILRKFRKRESEKENV